MSKRRQPGDVVLKRANAGFIGVACTIRLLPEDPAYEMPCCLCEDPKCREWADSEVLENGEVVAMAYHVSECEMEDLP